MRDMLGLVAGYGLLTVTGNEHRQMRRAMNPAFSLAALMSRTLGRNAIYKPELICRRDGDVLRPHRCPD